MKTKETGPSAIDLMVLGMLLEGPMSAYDLAALIERKQVNRFIKISAPAVYKTCRRLNESGMIAGKRSRSGERPEKTVYRVAEAGKKRFMALMERYSSFEPTPFFLDLNAFIFHVEKAGRERGLKMLAKTRDELAAMKAWIIEHEREASPALTFSGRAIVRQYRMTVTALLEWAEETLREFGKSTLS